MRSIKLAEDVTSWELDITRLYKTHKEEEAALLRALGLAEDSDETTDDLDTAIAPAE